MKRAKRQNPLYPDKDRYPDNPLWPAFAAWAKVNQVDIKNPEKWVPYWRAFLSGVMAEKEKNLRTDGLGQLLTKSLQEDE